MYKITFDLPDAGFAGADIVSTYKPAKADPIHALANEMVEILTDTKVSNRRFLTRLHRSVDRYSFSP